MRPPLKPMALIGVCVVASVASSPSVASSAQEEMGPAIEEHVDASALRIGTSTTFHVTIRRTEGAAHVRIHNSSPSAFSLEGGDDQLLTIGGEDTHGVRQPLGFGLHLRGARAGLWRIA